MEKEKRVHSFLAALLPWQGWKWAGSDALALYDTDFASRTKGRAAFLSFVVIVLLFWAIYVPVHEFLHVAGCALAGGKVDELVIGRGIGGAYWAKIFPFVTVEPGFGGRISQFDPGSDLGFLLTDIFPYFLTPIGIYLLRHTVRKARIALAGPAIVLSFAPFLNLFGDYYEMGSIIVTVPFMSMGTAAAEGLRTDDLIGFLSGLPGNAAVQAMGWPVALTLTAAGFIIGLVLAGWVYGCSRAAFPPWDGPKRTQQPGEPA